MSAGPRPPEQVDHTGRGWVYGDQPCPYSGGCHLPLRTHMHYSHGPSDPFHVVFYDEQQPASERQQSHICQGLGQMEYHATGERFTRWTCTCGATGEASSPAEAANGWHEHATRSLR